MSIGDDVFPSNSKKTRKEGEPKPPATPIEMKGKMVEKKPSLSERIAATFTGDDAQSVGSYILFNVIIPMAKDMIYSAFTEGASRVLFGSGPRGSTSVKSNGYTNYHKVGLSDGGRTEPRTLSATERATHDFSKFVFSAREDAVEVLGNLRMTLEEYGRVGVPDLYQMINQTPKFVDEAYGWTNLASATVRHTPNGWFIDLPKPIQIV